MARIAEGWKLVWNRGIARVRFTLGGRRHSVSTRSRDPEQAARIAAKIYADFVSGRVKRSASGALVHPATPLDELCADWLDAIANELGDGTGGTYEVYARHWCAAMPTIGDVTSAGIGEYGRARLGSVTRDTVIKERGGLRRCLTWFVERGILGDVPEFPALPKKATGKRHAQGRRKPVNVFSPAEVEAILAELPDTSRDFCEALYETGLRPRSTLERLVPGDLTEFGLHIRAEADKNRWERTIPVSERARAALQRGLPFGRHDRREGFRNAIKRALGDTRTGTVYDLKHARITAMVDAGCPLGGISYLTGVSIETLTSRYAKPTRRAAEDVMRFLSGPADQRGSAHDRESSCAKEGTRTPMGVTPLAPQARGVAGITAIGRRSGAEFTAGNSTPRIGSGVRDQNPIIREAPLGTDWPHPSPRAYWRHPFCRDDCPQHGGPECRNGAREAVCA